MADGAHWTHDPYWEIHEQNMDLAEPTDWRAKEPRRCEQGHALSSVSDTCAVCWRREHSLFANQEQ